MYKSTYKLDNFSIDVLKDAIGEFLKGKPVSTTEEKKYVSPYIQLTRQEVLDLKNGDECYIMSSYGMQKTTYPDLEGDTHRNMFGKGGTNKTPEEKRDFGPIYKYIDQ